MAGKPSKAAFNLDALTGRCAHLRAVAGDEMTSAALTLLRERLGLTPEKLMAMFLREIAPDELLAVPEECAVRGITAKPLKAMKDAKEIPPVLTGRQ